MGNRTKQLSKDKTQMVEEDFKKCLTFLALREMQTKTNLRSYTIQNGQRKQKLAHEVRIWGRTSTHGWDCKLLQL